MIAFDAKNKLYPNGLPRDEEDGWVGQISLQMLDFTQNEKKFSLKDVKVFIRGLKNRVPPEAWPIIIALSQLRHFNVWFQGVLNAIGLEASQSLGVDTQALMVYAWILFLSYVGTAFILQKMTFEKRGYVSAAMPSAFHVLFQNPTLSALFATAYQNGLRVANVVDYISAGAVVAGGEVGKQLFAINLISWTIVHVLVSMVPNVLIYNEKDKPAAAFMMKLFQEVKTFVQQEFQKTEKITDIPNFALQQNALLRLLQH